MKYASLSLSGISRGRQRAVWRGEDEKVRGKKSTEGLKRLGGWMIGWLDDWMVGEWMAGWMDDSDGWMTKGSNK